MVPILLLLSTFLLAFLLYLLLNLRTLVLSTKSQHTHPPLPPGPMGWPILGNLLHLGPKPHQSLYSMSLTYGPLFHLTLGSVHVVVASSATVAALFLKNHDANFSNRPVNSGGKYMAYDCHDIAWAPYGPRWRMMRKICSQHILSPKAIQDFCRVRQEEAAALVRDLAAVSGGPAVKVGQLLNVCTANSLTKAMMGRRLFSVEDEHAKQFKEMVVELTTLAGAFVVGDFLPALGWLDLQGVVGKMKRLAHRFDVFLDRIIEEHLESSGPAEQHKDMMSVLIGLKEENADEEGGKLTNAELKALLLDLFSAGTDTSSSTVEWALAELIRHPTILAQAKQELDSVVGRDRLVSEMDLANLPLVQAIIKETFRLHPSTPLALPHMAAADCEINGYYIPKNTTLFVNVWAIGRDPATWSDPLEFRPTRFLPGGEHAHVDVRGSDFELIPFGAGRRICAGMNWGLRMVQLMAATMIHAFDWGLPVGQAPDKLNMDELYGLTLQRAVPLAVCPIPRLAPHVYATV